MLVVFLLLWPKQNDQAMALRKKKKQAPHKFSTITFKLGRLQKKSLDKHCKAQGLTQIKLIKRAIEDYLALPDEQAAPRLFISPNQLDLFEEALRVSESNEIYQRSHDEKQRNNHRDMEAQLKEKKE
jgi:hypothetical protein